MAGSHRASQTMAAGRREWLHNCTHTGKNGGSGYREQDESSRSPVKISPSPPAAEREERERQRREDGWVHTCVCVPSSLSSLSLLL